MSIHPAHAAHLHRGARDSVAVIVAYVPFGLTIGAAMANADVPPLVAWASSPLLFGGAGQLLAVQLLGAGAGPAVTVLAALVVNARFLLYSAALGPHVADWPRRGRWAAAYLLADPVYALTPVVAAVVGGLAAVAASGLPLGLNVLVGAAAGVVAGALAGGRRG